jgi:hypothetical protein
VLAGAGGGYFMIARLDLPNAAIFAPVVMLIAGVVVTARVSFGRARLPDVPWIALSAMAATYAAVILWVLPRSSSGGHPRRRAMGQGAPAPGHPRRHLSAQPLEQRVPVLRDHPTAHGRRRRGAPFCPASPHMPS